MTMRLGPIRQNKTRITFFDLQEKGQKVISGFISGDYNLIAKIQLTNGLQWSRNWGVVKTTAIFKVGDDLFGDRGIDF